MTCRQIIRRLNPRREDGEKQARLGLYKAMEKVGVVPGGDSLCKSELKYQEIAQILDISEIAVKTRALELSELKSIYEKQNG